MNSFQESCENTNLTFAEYIFTFILIVISRRDRDTVSETNQLLTDIVKTMT